VSSAKMHPVKLIIVGENSELNCAILAVYNVLREEEELSILGDTAVFQKSDYVGEFKLN
jgi:hypothetical protein